MKKVYLVFLIFASLFIACEEDTFRDEEFSKEPPVELNYAETVNAFIGEAFNSGIPVVEAGGNKVFYAIEDVRAQGHEITYDEKQTFVIDATNGAITAPAGNTLSVDTYDFDIKVETIYAEAVFENGYSVTFETPAE
ncbi:hypothetical protein [Marinilabilia salmonicolor]|jgi:hypothetical protein|uniref:Uncharacterized protein n=1 Tax=Marinilabilia salmonicolor TaxID=989 RepID=A0A368VBA1_9BACT|nr:hypothetical protein [Marinilabilia salmonicolor]RCW37600.1 hypothetical protein DFO77_105109 [Marinilabilia salmonicolor]